MTPRCDLNPCRDPILVIGYCGFAYVRILWLELFSERTEITRDVGPVFTANRLLKLIHFVAVPVVCDGGSIKPREVGLGCSE